MPIDYIAQAATKTVEDCLAAVYVNPDDPSVFKQFKSTGCFQPFRTPSQGDGDIYAKKPDGTVLSDKVYKFIEGYAIEKGPDFCEWIYQLFNTVEFCLNNSADDFVDDAGVSYGIFQTTFVCPETFNENDEIFTGVKNISLEDMGDYFKDTLWQCVANNPFTSNRYGYTPFSYNDCRVDADFAFTGLYAVNDTTDINDSDKEELIGFMCKLSKMNNVYNSDYFRTFGVGGSSLTSLAISRVTAILQRLGLDDYLKWSGNERKTSFKKLMGYVMFHSAYDCRMEIQGVTPNDEDLSTFVFDAKFGSSKAWTNVTTNGKYAFTPSAEKMLAVLYDEPWTMLSNSPSDEYGDNTLYMAGSGYPRINMSTVTTENKYLLQNELMSRYYALGRCDAFAELGKMFCDVIDLKYGVNIHAKYIEATCGNHAWFMANIDGAFKFFDLCPYCTKSDITNAGLLDRNDIREGGSHENENSEWGTYNIDVETMIDPAFAATVGYAGVYDEGNFKMQPIAEPLNPLDSYYNDNYDVYSGEFKDTYENVLLNLFNRVINVEEEDRVVCLKNPPLNFRFMLNVGGILTYVEIHNDDLSEVYPLPLDLVYHEAKDYREDVWGDGETWYGESLENYLSYVGDDVDNYDELAQIGLGIVNNKLEKFFRLFERNWEYDIEDLYYVLGIDYNADDAFDQFVSMMSPLISTEIDYDLYSLAFPDDNGNIPLYTFGIYFDVKASANNFIFDIKLDVDNKWHSVFAAPAIDCETNTILLGELPWSTDNRQIDISSDFGGINAILELDETGISPVMNNDDVPAFINNLNSYFEASEIDTIVYQANREFFTQNTFAAKFFSMLKGMDITLTSDLESTKTTSGKIIDVRPCNVPLCFGGEPDLPQSNITLNEFLAWAAEHGIQVALLPGVHYGVDGIEALQHSSM